MRKILVCGSIAYDHIMTFPGKFSECFLSEKLDHINVSFLVTSLKKQKGGTAPNIAYSLSLVGEAPVVLGTAGSDFLPYREWLNKNGVATDLIRIVEEDYTASCFITTDDNGNQFTTFYPGAMARDPELSLMGLNRSTYEMAVIAPTEPCAMTKWVTELRELGIPYLYDPGMQIPRLTAQELTSGIKGAKILVLNDYEHSMLKNKTGMTDEEILKSVELLVVTLGDQGTTLSTRREKVTVAAARPDRILNPTGAGDAFRAGLIKGYLDGLSLLDIGRLANTTAVYAVEHEGATEHYYTKQELFLRMQKNYLGGALCNT